MKKIPSVFKRDYDGTRLVYDEVVPGCEWVLAGEGVATVKYDGEACLVQDGKLYTRYDRKWTKSAKKRAAQPDYTPKLTDFKPAPDGWIAAEEAPDMHTGHWPGWIPVGDGPEHAAHREAWRRRHHELCGPVMDGTYELVGPKIQGNPYGLFEYHELWRHGRQTLKDCPRTFDAIRDYLDQRMNKWVEGIVWHHPDGRMAKIKRRDFGLPWPVGGDE